MLHHKHCTIPIFLLHFLSSLLYLPCVESAIIERWNNGKPEDATHFVKSIGVCIYFLISNYPFLPPLFPLALFEGFPTDQRG
jgi:hypothetical protein